GFESSGKTAGARVIWQDRGPRVIWQDCAPRVIWQDSGPRVIGLRVIWQDSGLRVIWQDSGAPSHQARQRALSQLAQQRAPGHQVSDRLARQRGTRSSGSTAGIGSPGIGS
ncbi:unnamed protein product, partial [Staurois parvus]